jgi:hypothetical protein
MTTEQVKQDDRRFVAAPSTCGSEFDDIAWTGMLAVHLRDDLHVGVRFNDEGVRAHVAAALGDRVRDDSGAAPAYSVRLGTPGRRKAAPLHHLYHGGRPVLGTRDLGRLLGGVARHLSPLLEPPAGLLVNAVTVRTPRGVLLVPADVAGMTGSVDRLLVPEGFAFADVPRPVLHLDDAAVEVPDPVVDIPATPDQLTALGPSVTEERLPAGRYPLAGWLLPVAADQVGPLRRSVAVAYAVRQLEAPYPAGAQAALDAMVGLVARVPMTGVSWATPDELVQQVRDAGLAA